MAKVHIKALGCRLNQSEAEQMAQNFLLSGHEVTQERSEADLLVVNSCTVTQEAARKSVKSTKREKASQKVVVTGCHSQVDKEAFKASDLVVDIDQKNSLHKLSLEKFGLDGLALGMEFQENQRLQLYPLVQKNTRAFVKVQDGCNLSCTFCLTTIARGSSRSRPWQQILQEVQDLESKGCKEVVLTGVHAGAYSDQEKNLAELIEILMQNTNIARLRLSSLEPWNFKDEWLGLWQKYSTRLCAFFHMSLQSGSASVLKRMKRIYTPAEYARKVALIRKKLPQATLTTDVIVGFPGESEAEHEESMAFVKKMSFADAHVFSFSPRPGTRAALMPQTVQESTKTLRSKEIKRLLLKSKNAYLESMLDKKMRVLWQGNGVGLSDHFLSVKLKEGSKKPVANSFSDVIIKELKDKLLIGEIAKHD